MISSASHPHVSELRRLLGRRSARRDAGQFVAEGPTLVAEALTAGLEVRRLFASDEGLAALRALLSQGDSGLDGVEVVRCAPQLLERVLSTVTPQPVAAVVDMVSVDAGRFDVAVGGTVLVLAGVTDPGNAGTLIRSAEASGAVGVALCAGSVDPYNPKAVRAAAGSLFRLPVMASPLDELSLVASLAPRRIVASVIGGGTSHTAVDWIVPNALVIGSEAHGVSRELQDASDELVSIEMAGPVESLNAAMAGTVLLFEAARQRLAAAPTGAERRSRTRAATTRPVGSVGPAPP